jgi:hypothetical protein
MTAIRRRRRRRRRNFINECMIMPSGGGPEIFVTVLFPFRAVIAQSV